jgi:hypothetical protein
MLPAIPLSVFFLISVVGVLATAIAQRTSRCPICCDPIEEGDPIAFDEVDSEEWCHADCLDLLEEER